ncbi:putative bifunctional diguanylate cyclase/phosphodiesterase [Occallatibacter savannae]|uniref:putative bifunctional diguanylate cyclase/phosphodiesterase n=1 Tax=Occallatibacter savannae TaxID=1002691 RepID=UPI000D689284|nr:EAL domain-containing protein [Occallatibacter savannae]
MGRPCTCVPRLLAPVALLGLSLGAVAQHLTAVAELTNVRAVRHLKQPLVGEVPVHIHGVATYYDTVAPNLFVQDDTGGIWVDLRGIKETPPAPGDLLDIHGTVGAGFSPYIAKPHWAVVQKAALPRPARLTYDDAASGAWDSQWVQLEGVVRSFVQQAEGSVLVIDVATPTGSFKVRVPDYHGPFPMELVDAKVRFDGVCGASFNARKQFVSFHLMMPSLKNLEVLEPAPQDQFAAPATAIGDIHKFSADLTDEHRIKVVGTVTAIFPGHGIYLTDSTGGLFAESQDGTPMVEGDQVEVIGFPAAGSFSPVLKSARIRPAHKHSEPTISAVTGKTAMKGGLDAQLVRIDGTFRYYRDPAARRVLVVESPDHVTFEAKFARQPQAPIDLEPGSRITLTGICSIRADDNGNPLDFQLVLRTPADVRVLARPSWFTSQRAAYVVSALILASIAGIAWVFVLRRRIRQQTEVITRKLKNEMALEEKYRTIFERNLTGLYVASKTGEILDCNDACARILGFDSRRQLLDNRERAEEIIRKLHANSSEKSFTVGTEEKFDSADGTERWALCSIRPTGLGEDGAQVFEGSLIDITERKRAEEQIQTLAYFDSLTGLPNRTLAKDRLTQSLASAKRHRERMGLLYLDIDGFKIINDCLGHSIGDELLQQIANRLRLCAREEDTIARLGGDEFLIALGPIDTYSDVAVVAERIARDLAPAFNLHGHSLTVTSSIGISIYPDHGENVETLIKNADAAMYASKNRGRNTFSFFSEEMTTQAIERLQLGNSMRPALDRNEFFLVFQPEFDLSTGKVSCWEALIRWKHPDLGLISPDKFIHVAETNGMIVPIGEWVLRTACLHARSWHDRGNPIPVAVNVSAVQFRQAGFCDLVKDVLDQSGLDPEFLELEITESLLLATEDMRFEVLNRLKNLGVKLAIDDFGTGFSSLSYLKQLPVSKLKIDRSFVSDIQHNPNDEAITAAIIQMAKCLRLKVTAEGVENESQLRILRAHGCDDVQGFLFSKPLRPDQMDFSNRKSSALFEILSMGAAD